LLRTLAEKADVVVENFKPGVVGSIGLDYESLRAINPRLVYASISGFGSSGPYGGWPGVDQIAQGVSGFMTLTGERDGGPMRVGLPIGDLTAGMWATIGILGALRKRDSTGEGEHVETTLVGALIGLLCMQGQRYLSLGEVAGAPGNDHPVIAPYGIVEASDGPFNISVATQDMWRKLCELIGRIDLIDHPDYCDNGGRSRNLAALKQELNEAFAKDTQQGWTLKLIAAGIPAGPIYRVDQVFSDPHIRSQEVVETVLHRSIGDLRLVANPIRYATEQTRGESLAPPVFGEHTVEILNELNLDRAEIDALIDKKIVHAFKGETNVRK
jgi:crotonobetainyl-CoA:carnitine CoA-transferase CaiB-like acyl-CoA transferase